MKFALLIKVSFILKLNKLLKIKNNLFIYQTSKNSLIFSKTKQIWLYNLAVYNTQKIIYILIENMTCSDHNFSNSLIKFSLFKIK